MKNIGVLTFHNPINYGAVLQAYALEKYIEACGYDSEIINYVNERIGVKPNLKNVLKNKSLFRLVYNLIDFPFFVERSKKFNRFLNGVNVGPEKKTIDLDSYGKIIIGSDQVWNLNMTKNDFTYFLEGKTSALKCSYASSFGEDKIKEEFCEKVKACLDEFSFLSVRENSGRRLIEELLPHKEVSHVLDPTFLLSGEEWKKLAKPPKQKGKYLLVYQLAYSKELLASAKVLAKKRNLKIVTINGNPRQPIKAKYIQNAGPEEWLGLVQNAEIVLTNSFHGTVFSILFQKKFYTYLLKKQAGRNDRVISLLNKLGLTDHMLDSDIVDEYHEIDYSSVEKRKERLIAESKDYLCRILKYEN